MHARSFLAWLQFLRLPAVLTVPGDLWVGAVIAGRSVRWNELLGICLAYLFGMAMNDWHDREKDAVHRPERPLPSGRISPAQASGVCVGLAVGALGLYPAPETGLLLLTVLAYTLCKTWVPLVGAMLMGLCRIQSIWIGMGAGLPDSTLEWAVPLGGGILIFFITRLSQVEGSGRNGGVRSALCAAGLVLAAVAAVWLGGKQGLASWALLGALTWVAIANHAAIKRKGQVPPSAVGRYLSMWIPLQILWLLGGGKAFESVMLIVAAVALPWLQRKVAIS